MSHQCKDLQGDRALGEYWERQFCEMMADIGKVFTPMQIGRDKSASAWGKQNGKWNHWTLPDVTIWTAPGEHHEIKHKNPDKKGRFGLEHYRLAALLAFAEETQQSVFYTIHNHNGDRVSKVNRHEDWFTCCVKRMASATKTDGKATSYVNGVPTEVPCWYWKKELFTRLIP